MLQNTHNGVLIPAEMRDAPTAELDAYADRVKRGNRAVIDAIHAVEDAAAARGLTLDDLES